MNEQELLKKADFIVKKHGLVMKLLTAVFLDNNTKLLITFSADNRVDFRELVRDLAAEFRVRIELKQIGARDEAKEIGAISHCGQICCCKRLGVASDVASIKMAKNQNISLNPTRINGMCGKIMCCLAYEDDQYVNGERKK